MRRFKEKAGKFFNRFFWFTETKTIKKIKKKGLGWFFSVYLYQRIFVDKNILVDRSTLNNLRNRRERQKQKIKYGINPANVRQKKRQLFRLYGNKCVYCNKVNLQKGDATVDHIIPASKGGSSKLFNLQILCRKCNEKKDDKVPENITSRETIFVNTPFKYIFEEKGIYPQDMHL